MTRTALTLLLLFLLYSLAGAIDYSTEVRLACAQQFPEQLPADQLPPRCAALISPN